MFSGKDKKVEETTVRLNIEHSEFQLTFVMDSAEMIPTEIAFRPSKYIDPDCNAMKKSFFPHNKKRKKNSRVISGNDKNFALNSSITQNIGMSKWLNLPANMDCAERRAPTTKIRVFILHPSFLKCEFW